MTTDWLRISKISFAVFIAAASAYFLQPLISGNNDAINTIVTIFSILAGFLIALITFLASPVLDEDHEWEELQRLKITLNRKLHRQKILFFLYIAALGAAFALFLVSNELVAVKLWLERIFVGLTTFVFLASLELPGALVKIQQEKYEAALRLKRPKIVQDALNKKK